MSDVAVGPRETLAPNRLVYDQPERVGQWVAAKVDVEGFIPPYTALGWENAKGELTGGIIFNNFTGANVEASVAWDGPVARTMLKHVRKYVFGQHKCRRITIHTRKSRHDVISQAERLGLRRSMICLTTIGRRMQRRTSAPASCSPSTKRTVRLASRPRRIAASMQRTTLAETRCGTAFATSQSRYSATAKLHCEAIGDQSIAIWITT